jgi:hypothetical protein
MRGDLDLLPPSARGDSLGVNRLPRNGDELGDALSRSEPDQSRVLPDRETQRVAWEVHRHDSFRVAVNPSTFATGSPREPAEDITNQDAS